MQDTLQPKPPEDRSSDSSAQLRSEASSPKGWSSFNQSSDKKKKSLMWVGTGIVILLILGGGVYAGLRQRAGNDGANGNDGGLFNLPTSEDRQEEPPTTVSGLSGMPCEDPDRRPIGVMLAGDPINRPVSGFAKADMVFELPVLTSDVTRLTAVYQCGQPADIGSVRSVRHDYLFLAEGVDAIMAHWGGSYHALNRIAVGEFQTLNALSNPHNTFFRKNHLPAPYNGFTTYERMWNAVQKLGYRTETTFKGYDFKDDISQDERISGGTLSIAWPGAFRVHYEYDPTTNRYQRFWAGVKQVDGEDSAPVQPSSIAIMRATNQLAAGEGGYNDVAIEGQGELEVYQDGKVIKGTWKKNELDKKDPVHFLNDQGNPIVFTRGQVWVMAVEPTIAVTWQPAASPAATQ